MSFCPQCGKDVPENAKYCMSCGARTQPIPGLGESPMAPQYAPGYPPQYVPQRRGHGVLVAAGVLIIIAASFCIVAAPINFANSYYSEYYYSTHTYSSYYDFRELAAGMFAILGFAFGITSGICALKRKKLPLAIIGVALVIISGALELAQYSAVILIGLIVLILSILGLVMVCVRYNDFLSPTSTAQIPEYYERYPPGPGNPPEQGYPR